jgi:hypothetical protein
MKTKTKKKITKEMLDNFDNVIREWKWNKGDYGDPKSMKKVYASDRKNLNSFYTLIEKGDYCKAGRYASNLDTIIRDIIPDDIYDIIMDDQVNGE